jgi:putative thioredoxin
MANNKNENLDLQKDQNLQKNNYIVDVNTENFMAIVIEQSKSTPVIVDFWAPWCGPCRMVTPILEKIVNGENGRIILAKMNIDDNPEIPQQLKIKSIPAIIAFYDSQPVDGFAGVQPESAIKEFISKQISLSGTSEEEKGMEIAKEMFLNEETEQSLEIFGQIAQSEPENISAISMIGKCYLRLGELEKAKNILASIENKDNNNQDYISLKAEVDLLRKGEEKTVNDQGMEELMLRVEKNPNDHEANYDLAINFNTKGHYKAALDRLLSLVYELYHLSSFYLFQLLIEGDLLLLCNSL